MRSKAGWGQGTSLLCCVFFWAVFKFNFETLSSGAGADTPVLSSCPPFTHRLKFDSLCLFKFNMIHNMIKLVSTAALALLVGGTAGFLIRDRIALQPTSSTSQDLIQPSPDTRAAGKSPTLAIAPKSNSAPVIPVHSQSITQKKTHAPSAGVSTLLEGARSYEEFLSAFENMVPRLRGSDPVALAQSTLDMPDGFERDATMMFAFGQFAETDPQGAIRFVESMPEGEARDQAMKWVASGLQPGNLSQAIAIAEKIEDYDTKKLILAQVITSECKENPAGAISSALKLTDPKIRRLAVSSSAEAWASSDPSSALKYAVDKADPSLRSQMLAALSSAPDADSAVLLDAVVQHMPAGDEFEHAISDLFTNWVENDPAAAAQGLSKLPPGPSSAAAAGEVGRALVESNPDKNAIAAWALGLPEGNVRLEGLRGVFDEWGKSDPQAALAQASKLSGAERQTAVTRLVDSWAVNNPGQVLDWVSRGAGGFSDALDMATQSAMRSIASNSPNDATAKLASVPAAYKASATLAIVESWSFQDAEAAAQWLGKQPRGPQTDGAAGLLARSISREDPETAMQWALGISNPKARMDAAREVATMWKQNDPAAARDYATRNGGQNSVSRLFEN